MPDIAVHLAAFETYERESHVGPVNGVLSGWIWAIEINIIDVEREPGIKVVPMYLWPGSSRFTSSNVEEAELVPYYTSHMDIDSRQVVMRTITMEPHTLGKSNRSSS